jgi:hypothetical protein
MVHGSMNRSLSWRGTHSLLAAVALALLASLFSSAPALAGSSPEAPIMQCDPLVIPAGGPFVCGTLNPHSKEKLTNAYFTFNAGSTCTGAQQVAVEPEVQGEEHIEVRAKPVDLVPGTEYAFCLVAVNSSGETVSDPLTFTTTAEPKSEPATVVTSTSATLEGTLEPAGVKLKYQLFYSKGSTCEGGVATAEAEGENKVSAQVEGLASNTEYTFCLEVKGHEPGFILSGEQNVGRAFGQPEHFTTIETQAEKEAWLTKFAEENAKRVAEEAAVRMRHEEEATAAAARKHQEEEVAASHKKEEEAARKKKKAEPPDTGGIALAATTVTVQSDGEAFVNLNCLGIASCHGKLTLRAGTSSKGRKKARPTSIGTLSFTIVGDEAKMVKVKLDAAGRALLGADQGRLNASLAILELAPGPANAQTKAVQLVQRKTAKGRKR